MRVVLVKINIRLLNIFGLPMRVIIFLFNNNA